MKTVKFVKGPGYFYDLISMFVLHFNKSAFLADQVNQNKEAEDTEHFKRILDETANMPEELRVFFHLKDDGVCFFSSVFFDEKIKEVSESPWTDIVRNTLKNYNEVIANVAEYYFGSDVAELSVDNPEYIRIIGRKVRDSGYDVVLKNSLYEFFLDPVSALQTLSNELMKKEVFLSRLCSESDALITKVQNKINVDRLLEKTATIKIGCFDAANFDEVVVSICVAHKNCFVLNTEKAKVLILLGVDYEDFFDYLNAKDHCPELTQFGIALAEENRIRILEYIRERGEASVSDLKQDLKLTHTNAYYHISLLMKAKFLTFRNSGRTVLYRINRQCIRDICTVLTVFSQKGGVVNEILEETDDR